MKSTVLAAVLSAMALSACGTSQPSSKPIWEAMKEDDDARARTLGGNSFRPQDNPFPPSQPVWRGSRPN